MPHALTRTSYGKSRIRLVQVARRGDRHELRDLTVAVAFEGDYDTSYTDGDNAHVLPTDTMKNTVYALAAREGVGEPEAFGMALGVISSTATRSWRASPSTWSITPGAASWSAIASTARRSCGAGRSIARRASSPIALARRSPPASADLRHHEVVSLGVCRIPARRVHDAAGDARSAARHGADRRRGPTASATSSSARRFARARPRCSKPSREHDSLSVQHTLYAMGQMVLDTIDAVRASRSKCRIGITCRSTSRGSACRTATRSSSRPKSRTA